MPLVVWKPMMGTNPKRDRWRVEFPDGETVFNTTLAGVRAGVPLGRGHQHRAKLTRIKPGVYVYMVTGSLARDGVVDLVVVRRVTAVRAARAMENMPLPFGPVLRVPRASKRPDGV